MVGHGKPLVWLHGEIKTPPFSVESRRNAGYLLRLLQLGTALAMPTSRPMPSIGVRCYELRIRDPDQRVTWRLVYRVDDDAIIIETCKRRFRQYDQQSQ